MSNQNHFFVGNLTRDPESRNVSSGDMVANFSVAINGLKPEDTVYLDCETWGKTAEFLMKYFKKGKPIVVLDSVVRNDTWNDKTTGEKRSKHKYKVNRIGFAPGSKGDENDSETETTEVAPSNPKRVNSKPSQAAPVLTSVEDDEDNIPF